jgi:hypothetical protein
LIRQTRTRRRDAELRGLSRIHGLRVRLVRDYRSIEVDPEEIRERAIERIRCSRTRGRRIHEIEFRLVRDKHHLRERGRRVRGNDGEVGLLDASIGQSKCRKHAVLHVGCQPLVRGIARGPPEGFRSMRRRITE